MLLIDPAPCPGPGLAYGAATPIHRLNSRAAAMSALADQPDDFTAWLAAQALPADPAGFATRRDYGRYLTATLDATAAAHPGRLRHRVDHAVRLGTGPDGVRVELHRGDPVRADRAVLAVGHGRPCRLAAVGDAAYAHPGYIHDPWHPGALDSVPDEEPVLLDRYRPDRRGRGPHAGRPRPARPDPRHLPARAAAPGAHRGGAAA